MISREEAEKLVLTEEQQKERVFEGLTKNMLASLEQSIKGLSSIGKTQLPKSLATTDSNGKRAVEFVNSQLVELGYHTDVSHSDDEDDPVSFLMVGWGKDGLVKPEKKEDEDEN